MERETDRQTDRETETERSFFFFSLQMFAPTEGFFGDLAGGGGGGGGGQKQGAAWPE